MAQKSDTSLKIKIGTTLALTGFLFLYTIGQPAGIGHIPRWIPITALVFLMFGLIILIEPKLKRKKESEKINNIYLMIYGQKITVDLSNCELKENFDLTEFILTFKYSSDNRSELFSSSILRLNKNFLLSKLQSKKQTFIYVDNRDRSKYFFDTDFLIF